MLTRKRTTILICALQAVFALLAARSAIAVEVDVSGLVRHEAAYSFQTIGDENPLNQGGNFFNGQPTINTVNAALGIDPATLTRPDSLRESNDLNLNITRFQLDVDAHFGDSLKFVAKLRGIYAWDTYDGFGEQNYFETPFRGDCATRLEICGDDYMVDLPSFYFDYNSGGFWLRLGNQQIAWGESIFFRVLDTPNGLDLRRHSILDLAAEEFSDKRVPALGVRSSYQFDSGWELEGWVQEFQATVFSDEDTPYNLIPSQFVVRQQEGFDEVDDEWNFGARLRGQVGELGLQLTYTNRLNPDLSLIHI